MRALPPLAVFAASFFLFAFLFLAAPSIPDADSYYHLAVAREFAANGYPDALPWARFSVLGRTFGDKELGFHWLLVPFTWADAATGGRLALALLNAAVAASITGFAARTAGWWSVLVPLWLYAAAPMMTFRLIRLRPELLALLLLLALIAAASRKRYVWIGAIAALFALSYTAFHVVLGLAALWFLIDRDWKLPAAAFAGTAIGLLAHPGFPGNLRVWWIQNVLFFLEKSRLDVGTEITAATTDFFFLGNLGWWAGIALLWWGGRRAGFSPPRDGLKPVLHLVIAAAVFAILALLMQRFAVYFVPLLTLVALERLRRPRLVLALLATALLSLPATARIYRELLIDNRSEPDYTRFARALPPGAKVAAHWGPAEFYTFFAPHGRYLNVLDPVFMAVPFPRVYTAQRRLFEGSEPDVPGVTKDLLDSDYLAFPADSPLFERVQHDPRIVPLYSGATFLGRIVPSNAFVRDWNGKQHGAYVDARGKAPCTRLVREESVAADATRIYELAPYGPAEITIGDALHLRAGPSRAILGRGTAFRVQLSRGTHRFTVTTCRDDSGTNGFYLLLRASSPLSPARGEGTDGGLR
ncbi:MAG TPA: hypothetical protein VEO54_32450 [Thermoanaerobaculia bacterium]|nr:hypothetical protein [Thermoanaerobaculia bacterium]